MQENEKYGIELEAKTNLFKKGLQEAIKYSKAFVQGVKESFGEQITKTARNWRSAFKEAFTNNGYDKELETLKQRYEETSKLNYEGKDEDLKYLESEISRVQELKDKQKNYNTELEDTNEQLQQINQISSKTNFSLHSLFDKSIGKIKRFTYYLLGARSVFSLFMRYRSAYYQFNEEMQYQSELSQNAIALSLGPAFEFLGNVIAYASIGLAKFIELLTGVNVLSKVTTKGIRDYNKSLKETQTLVSGIDEITNLTNPQNLGLASQYQALADFQKKVAEVEKFFSENKWIEDIANGLKTIWKFLAEQLIPKVGEFIDSIGGAKGALKLLGGVGVMSVLGKLIGVAGAGAKAGTGLAGVAGLLSYIAGLGIITIYIKYLQSDEAYDDLMNERKGIAKGYRSTYNDIMKLLSDTLKKQKNLDKNSKEYQDNLKKINNYWSLISKSIQGGDKDILNSLDDAKDLAKELDDMTNTNYYTKTFDLSKELGIQKAEDMSKSLAQKLAGLVVGQNRIDEDRRKSLTNEFNDYEEKINKVVNKATSLKDKLISLTKKAYTLKISVEVVSAMAKGATQGALALSQAIAKSIKGYASGLDYVPYDNYPALLHKGEQVLTK